MATVHLSVSKAKEFSAQNSGYWSRNTCDWSGGQHNCRSAKSSSTDERRRSVQLNPCHVPLSTFHQRSRTLCETLWKGYSVCNHGSTMVEGESSWTSQVWTPTVNPCGALTSIESSSRNADTKCLASDSHILCHHYPTNSRWKETSQCLLKQCFSGYRNRAWLLSSMAQRGSMNFPLKHPF